MTTVHVPSLHVFLVTHMLPEEIDEACNIVLSNNITATKLKYWVIVYHTLQKISVLMVV